MRVLPKPEFGVAQVYAECVAGVGDTTAKSKLASVAGTVAFSEVTFETLAASSTLHTVCQTPDVQGVVSIEEMKALYKEQMSSARGCGRAYYDALRNAAPNTKCPLCGVGVVSTLDHHLPQSKYPDLTVSPLNLVPSCFDCNKAKLAKFPSAAGEQTIHPYFDDFNHSQWVQATIDVQSPLTVSFGASAPATWGHINRKRVERHFSVFKLAVVFGSNANDELIVIKPVLQNLHSVGGSDTVQSHLVEQAKLHSVRPNSWQHALYQSLANDDWFCCGGFDAIPNPG